MPILSGQIVTADDLNHLKPATYHASASVSLVGVVTDADIVGATITFDTDTDNAVYVATGDFDADWDGAATGLFQGKLAVDGGIQTELVLISQAAGAAGDRIPGSHTWRGTLATAGTHTLKLIGTVPDVDQAFESVHTALTLVIYEVV